jgi:aminoglycoside 3-N-acetyltransferase
MGLFEKLSGFAVRHFKREHVTALRDKYLIARKKLHPIMRAVYGTFDTVALRRHLEERVGSNFEILMVHSSVNGMKPMYTDDPLSLVKMLIDFCGQERTLVMPAFYFGDSAVGGVFETFRQNPRIDIRRTASQMGLVTELFRRSRGVVQSRHPLYRVSALGPLADALVQGHESAATPSGAGTPFDFMANHNTQIIGIGKRFDVTTQVHHAEDLLGDAFPVPRHVGQTMDLQVINGKEEMPFSLTQRGFDWQRNMWKLRQIMDRESLREWNFHHVPLFATRASDVTRCLTDAAQRGVTLYDPP